MIHFKCSIADSGPQPILCWHVSTNVIEYFAPFFSLAADGTQPSLQQGVMVHRRFPGGGNNIPSSVPLQSYVSTLTEMCRFWEANGQFCIRLEPGLFLAIMTLVLRRHPFLISLFFLRHFVCCRGF